MKHSLQVLIRVGARPGAVRVEVEGCLTQASCPDLIRILDHGTRMAGCAHIWVDLFSLDHMDLAGVAALRDYARHRQDSDDDCPRISIYAPSVPRPCTAVPGHVARYGSPSASRILSGGWR